MAINCLVPWGTEAIPRVRCSRPNGSEQERWRRFDPTLFGVGVHPPRRGVPDRCIVYVIIYTYIIYVIINVAVGMLLLFILNIQQKL